MNTKNKGKKGCTLCRKLFVRKELANYQHGMYCKECLEKYKEVHYISSTFGGSKGERYLK